MSDDSLITEHSVKPTLEYPCGEAPPAGEVREVMPGILWLRMPLPFALVHINLWAVRDGDGWSVFDSGVQTSETAAAWRRLFGVGGGLASGGLTRLFVTHMHPDHVGMAGWLTRKFNCRLWMTRLEYLTCRVLVADTGREAPEDGVGFYRKAGWDDDAIENYRARFGGFGKLVHAIPDSYRRLFDDESIQIGGQDWRVIVGHGHSPEHACFHNAQSKVFVSGDQVLPRISSNVSVFPTEPDADPLGDWLSSIDKIRREVPDDVLVLPSHNEPFRGLHARLDYLAHSQHQALNRLRRALTAPKRAVDVFGELFSRPINSEPNLLGMATGESIAHLNNLLRRDEAIMEVGVDGVAWYRSR
jgi:glyoxylase-like metal-dependent hydrolase (beta-lactamase superfamily II)